MGRMGIWAFIYGARMGIGLNLELTGNRNDNENCLMGVGGIGRTNCILAYLYPHPYIHPITS